MILLWDCGLDVTHSDCEHTILTYSGFLNFQFIALAAPFPSNVKALSSEPCRGLRHCDCIKLSELCGN